MSTIRAKPTTYAGTRFRSRLEARWASFFDAIGREWIYEPEVPELKSLGYQPDFLTDNGVGGTQLVEIKPQIDSEQMIQLMEDKTWQRVANLTKCRFVLTLGQPGEWVEGQLGNDGHIALWFDPDDDAVYGSFAECETCGSVRMWPRGVAACHRKLPTGPLREAYERVRDTSFGNV